MRGVSPSLGARLAWIRLQRQGDTAVRVVDALVHRGDTVVDVGANWGLYTWRLSWLIGPAGCVYAFEPDPVAVARVGKISHRKLTVYPIALSDHSGEAKLHVPLYQGERISALASLTANDANKEVTEEVLRVKVQRLDAIIPEAGPAVTFIKCDVEGHELAVLRGAETILRRSRPALLVEVEQRNGGRVQDTIEYLTALDYDAYALHTDGLIPAAKFDLQRDQLAYLGDEFMPHDMPDGYINDFLFVRSGSNVNPLLAPR